MSACPQFDHLLVLPRLRVQNANAVSSPLTHGFPSVTAFQGLMWALQRKARTNGLDLAFEAVGTVCHDHQEQAVKNGFEKVFCLTRNPSGKDGSAAAIVEEGRIHLDLSLMFAIRSKRWKWEPQTRDADIVAVAGLLAGMRIAGGTLLPPAQPGRLRYRPWVIDLTGNEDDQQAEFRKARMRLLPGFALVSREDRLEARLAELQAEHASATRLDAWLSLFRINWRYQPAGNDGKGEWLNDRKGQGWIVPIPVGYGALGDVHEPGSVANARDASTPFRFVESLYSIGEWISPHRLQSPQQLLWYSDSQPDDGLYRCRNDYRAAADEQLYDFD
ncbi:type I-F CRISPR-associated protein Csy2 [Dokdonella koreensis]|uniref:CRISPR-associated protein, Csy2 family n=1 Tax=Dokdonella koreensis DS-123 TaxID=1300342 RepID=A0A160DUR0_9GAMM|nr:type I-F CRISPR-associated protein Csy2 [Dokdonella koreensis]ANB17781.1 CRISPR-associated protein, Csy2 family [Dokdonella koreensis DS-123]